MTDNLFKPQSSRVEASEKFIVNAKPILNDLVQTSGVDGVLLATTDGFEVSSIFKNEYDAGKLSAVGSSILALVQALVTEARLTGCRSVILDAENGKIMINAISNKNLPMIAIVLTKQQVLLGQVMHAMTKATKNFIELDAAHNPKP